MEEQREVIKCSKCGNTLVDKCLHTHEDKYYCGLECDSV